MGKIGAVVTGLVAVLAGAGVDGPPVVPADFKIHVESFGLAKEPVFTEEIVVREGKAYLFPSNSKEVVIFEPAQARLEIVDVGRSVQTEVTFKALDLSLEKIKTTLREEVEKREKLGGKANVVEARMTRDLFETKLNVVQDPRLNRVRLTNPAVEVVADGESEADAPRLAMVATILNTVAKLGAFRSPTDLPPFVELEAIASLTGDRKLRPTELTYLYRLAGPPQKFHRTYRLVPKLTDREIEAIARINRLREVVPSVRYERYRTRSVNWTEAEHLAAISLLFSRSTAEPERMRGPPSRPSDSVAPLRSTPNSYANPKSMRDRRNQLPAGRSRREKITKPRTTPIPPIRPSSPALNIRLCPLVTASTGSYALKIDAFSSHFTSS